MGLFLALGWLSGAGAGQPGWIRYQGRLIENGILANRPDVLVTFHLYDQAVGGTLLYREADTVTVAEGFYATDLGDNPHGGSPNGDFARALTLAGTNAWLAVSIDAGPELQPRERLGGAPFAVNAGGLRRVLTVGPGGEYATIGEALAAITDNGATHPYLVKVSPGVFAERVTMKPFVDIEGCGRGVTTIAYASTNAVGTDWAVLGASNTEMRCLGLAVTGMAATVCGYRVEGHRAAALRDVSINLGLPAGASGKGVVAEGMSSVDLRDVDVTVTGAAADTRGISLTTGSSAKIRAARVTLSGCQGCTAITSDESVADLENIVIDVSDVSGNATGMSAGHGGLSARDVDMTVRCDSAAIGFNASEATLDLRDVKAVLNGGGECTGVNAGFGAVYLRESVIEMFGVARVRGLQLFQSEATVADTRLSVRGGTPNEGVNITRICTLGWTGGRMDLAGAAGATNLGVRCSDGATLELHGVAMRLEGGGGASDGIVLEGTSGSAWTNRIDQCIVSSPGNAIRATSAIYSTFCRGSLLQGGLVRSAGTLRTVHCHDDACAAIADGDH
jgi:hypothetical protein